MEAHQVGCRATVHSSTTGDQRFIGKAIVECPGSWNWEIYPEDNDAIRCINLIIRDIPKGLAEDRPPGNKGRSREHSTSDEIDLLIARIQHAADLLEEDREANQRPARQREEPDPMSLRSTIDKLVELASDARRAIDEGKEAYDEAALQLTQKADQANQACILCLEFVFPHDSSHQYKGNL